MRLGGPLEHSHPVTEMLDTLLEARPALRQEIDPVKFRFARRLQGERDMAGMHRIERAGVNSDPPSREVRLRPRNEIPSRHRAARLRSISSAYDSSDRRS